MRQHAPRRARRAEGAARPPLKATAVAACSETHDLQFRAGLVQKNRKKHCLTSGLFLALFPPSYCSDFAHGRVKKGVDYFGRFSRQNSCAFS